MNIIHYLVYSIVLGFLSLLLYRYKTMQWLLFFLVMLLQAYAAYTFYLVLPYKESIPLGIISLHLEINGLRWIFYTASTAITLLISLFSLSYNTKGHATSIAPLWIFLMTANMTLFFSSDWITFLIAWEVMSWTSFFIISQGKDNSYKAGMYYYTISLIGTVCLIAAVFIIYTLSGTMFIHDSIRKLQIFWMANPFYLYTIITLLLITFFAKSALGPFYMWPAKAHAEAPDDFSSFLSGVMIKYGVFGIIIAVLPFFKLFYQGPTVHSVPVYLHVIGWIGGLTAVLGTLLAIRENDMKRLMAFSTVSNMGLILAALSVNTVFAIAAAIFHTVNHMVFKTSIFLSMASVKYRTNEREMHKLGGIAYKMPLTFFTFLIGIIAAAGIPPMNGFASKWMIFQSLFEKKLLFLAIPAFFASTGSFMYLYRGMHSIYLGQLSPRFNHIKEAPLLQAIPMMVVMLIMYGIGTWPGIFLIPINNALSQIGYQSIEVTLSEITGSTSVVNLTTVSAAFLFSFFGVLFLYIIGKKRQQVGFLDTYTAGEDPKDWNMTPEQYHYAYNFYEPFEKLINPLLHNISFERLFESIRFSINRFSLFTSCKLHSSSLSSLLFIFALLIILIAGVL